jgi:hypothetical protein
MAYLRPTNLPIESHLKADQSIPDDLVPKDGNDLPELGQYQFNLSFDEAASLGFPVARLDEQYSHEVLIFQAARFKDVFYEGATFRYGAAVEAIITASVIKGDGSATVAAVAASVQLSYANATSSLSVRGYLPQAQLELPEWGEFDVGAYAKFQATVSDLQKILFDNAHIRPQLLATTMPESSGDYGSAVGQTYALDAISHGFSANDALGRLDKSDPEIRAAVEKTYEAASLSDSETPGPEARLKAKEDLEKIHVPITRHWRPFWRKQKADVPEPLS